MSKDLGFRVELTFSDKIVDDVIVKEIAQKIANAIVNECNTSGILPDYCDGYTEIVRVTPWYSSETIVEHP